MSAPQRRGEYLDLYKAILGSRISWDGSGDTGTVLSSIRISVHYPHHARKIHAPVYEALLRRLCAAHRLPDRDGEMLEDLISHHMECGFDFKVPRPERIRRYTHIAMKRGYDADDFIDLAQASLLLDQTIGSLRLSAHGYWHETKSFINFLQSEHDFAPHRRAEKEAVREASEKKNAIASCERWDSMGSP